MTKKVYASSGLVNVYELDIVVDSVDDIESSEKLSTSEFRSELYKVGKKAVAYLRSKGIDAEDLEISNKGDRTSCYIYFYPTAGGRNGDVENVLLINYRISDHPHPNPRRHAVYLKDRAQKQSNRSVNFYASRFKDFVVKNRTYDSLQEALDHVIKSIDNVDPDRVLKQKLNSRGMTI